VRRAYKVVEASGDAVHRFPSSNGRENQQGAPG
jgi:hypothetical protein